MEGFDTTDLVNFKTPLPVKGVYVARIKDAKNAEGTKPDANDELSKGIRATFVIEGPDSAIMTDGNSAIGAQVEQGFWLPRQSLVRSNPTQAAKMKKAFGRLLTAPYGNEEVPANVKPADLNNRLVLIHTSKPKFDNFQDDDIVEVEKIEPCFN